MSSFLDLHNISKESLFHQSNIPCIHENGFSNGIAAELYSLTIEQNLIFRSIFPEWVSALTGLDLQEINKEALFAKVYRVLKKIKSQRKHEKQNYLSQRFIIPTQTVTSESLGTLTAPVPAPAPAELQPQPKLQKEEIHQETREKAKQLKRKYERLANKSAVKKRKLDQTEEENKQLKKRLKETAKTVKQTSHRLGREQVKKAKNVRTILNLKNNELELKRENKEMKTEVENLRVQLQENNESVAASIQQKEQLTDANIQIDYLHALLEDRPNIKLFDETANKYTNDTVMCVMNLTDMKVPVERVGPVIKEVAKMCGKTVDRVPAAKTVNRIVDSKLAMSQKQIGEVLGDKEKTTLYTDETRKYGKCLQTYILTDEDQKSYILGLREMVDKSGQSTLDTFKDILSDITTYCNEKGDQRDIGYGILSNIRDTMSDRASTEKHFNVLLEEFRSEILPEVVDNWENLSEEEKRLCSKMNNFYCGLHLLVGLADTCENTLKKFEKNYLDGEEVGSAAKLELKLYHKSESGTLRLMRTSSKCFAVGQDEKNGVSLPWVTYLRSKDEKNHIVRFKHNRFNLVFSMAAAVFYHRQQISDFLDSIHGTTNNLLKAVALDIKEDLLMAGLKAFGLISKLITGPLWKLLEAPGHILEMNIYYKQLIDFLLEGANDIDLIEKFIEGKASPFNTVGKEDCESRALFEESDALNGILFPMLQALFLSMSELLSRMVADHLPGGAFYQPSDQVIADTKSAMKHNKLLEFVFGQLDQLLRYRPNATLLTNESYLMYSHNKTREWLSSMDDEEREKLLNNARKEGQQIRKQFKTRLREIEAKRLELQELRRRKLEETERKRMMEIEKKTTDICYYGLWQSEAQLDEGMERLETQSEKREGLKAQLRFRKSVLKQKNRDPKVYNFSKKGPGNKYVALPLDEMKENVLTLIKDCLNQQHTTEKQHQDIPLLVGKHVKHTFSDGKNYKGHVISVVPGFSDWYNIKYDDDEAIYAYNLCQDYKQGDLQLVVGE